MASGHMDSRKRVKGGYGQLKVDRERLLIQEDPRIMVLVVEPVLHLAYGAYGTIDVRIAREHEERRIGGTA